MKAVAAVAAVAVDRPSCSPPPTTNRAIQIEFALRAAMLAFLGLFLKVKKKKGQMPNVEDELLVFLNRKKENEGTFREANSKRI